MQIKRLACAGGLLAAVCALAWSAHKRHKAREAWSAMPMDPHDGLEFPVLTLENRDAWLSDHLPTKETTDEEFERWLGAFFLKVSEASTPAGHERN